MPRLLSRKRLLWPLRLALVAIVKCMLEGGAIGAIGYLFSQSTHEEPPPQPSAREQAYQQVQQEMQGPQVTAQGSSRPITLDRRPVAAGPRAQAVRMHQLLVAGREP